ncbi:MAG TPA: GNAT family N-acetyltransferase [Alphaproteobacteria bacterium]
MWKKSDPVSIRLANRNDALGVAHCFYNAVHEKGEGFYLDDVLNEWAPPVTEARIDEHYHQLLDPDLEIFVAEAKGTIIGVMIVHLPEHKIKGLYVPSNPYGLVGTRLVKCAKERMKELGQEEVALDAAMPAVEFYQSRGFTETGRTFERRGMEYVPMKSKLN